MMTKEYELSEEDLERLVATSKPRLLLVLQSGMPPSAQELANMEWQRIGQQMGFHWSTARPVPGKGERFFSAMPLTPHEPGGHA